MWHHIIFFARYCVIPIWSLRRADDDLRMVFFILHVYINAGEFVASWSHTQHLINSETVTILTVKIIVSIDFQKSLINESAKVTMGKADCVRKCSNSNESISVS